MYCIHINQNVGYDINESDETAENINRICRVQYFWAYFIHAV